MADEPTLAADGAARQSVRRLLDRLRGKEEPVELRKLSPCLVTSAESGEGKSTLAATFAALAAREFDLRTLLVDLNWYKPSVHESFGLSKNYHIAEFLEKGPAEFIQKGVSDSLDVLTVPRFTKKEQGSNGDSQPSGAFFAGIRDFREEMPEASNSDDETDGKSNSKSWRLRTMRHLQTLQDKYDFVVMDGPAVYPDDLGPLDALQLAVASQTTLLVVMMRVTPRDTIKRAAMALQAQANLIGVVMNQHRNTLAH